MTLLTCRSSLCLCLCLCLCSRGTRSLPKPLVWTNPSIDSLESLINKEQWRRQRCSTGSVVQSVLGLVIIIKGKGSENPFANTSLWSRNKQGVCTQLRSKKEVLRTEAVEGKGKGKAPSISRFLLSSVPFSSKEKKKEVINVLYRLYLFPMYVTLTHKLEYVSLWHAPLYTLHCGCGKVHSSLGSWACAIKTGAFPGGGDQSLREKNPKKKKRERREKKRERREEEKRRREEDDADGDAWYDGAPRQSASVWERERQTETEKREKRDQFERERS